MTRIRALRDELRGLRVAGTLTASQYRHYYRRAKGGMYNSRAHLRSHMQTDGIEVKQ
jgi:large subunit ribosomal protein L19e